MQNTKLPLSDTRAFSSFFLDYLEQKPALQPFYNRFPSIENFKAQIEEKQRHFSVQQRELLASVLERQYSGVTVTDSVKRNISALRNKNTFSVTTGHQLNIFTGPLYFIYKIVTVINTCQLLSSRYPDYNFVPVYWMASEDHDYDEIKYFWLYGKKYVWTTEQQGAVGRFSTEGFNKLIGEIPGDISIFKEAYGKNETLSMAARSYVNALFGERGLLVIDADDRDLKLPFREVIRKDILATATHPLVENTNRSLEELNYKTQAHCRDVNFFYLDEKIRNRIERSGERFHVLGTRITFSEKEMATLIENHPEKLSPNVVLRPVYQELILPNVAYVGGPAEVIYWLQLKSVFDHYQIPFPMLMPRNFALVIEPHLFSKFKKTGLELQVLFEEKNFIINHWIVRNTRHNLTVGPERAIIEDIFKQLRERAGTIDKTLEPFVAAEGKRATNSLEKIEHKLLRAEKRFQSDKLRQIETLKDALFPGGNLQERHENFLNYYQKDPAFIAKLFEALDPFDFRFNVLVPEDV